MFMARRLVSAGAENRMLAKKRTAVATQGIGTDGATISLRSKTCIQER
jgi:hypothetical protein